MTIEEIFDLPSQTSSLKHQTTKQHNSDFINKLFKSKQMSLPKTHKLMVKTYHSNYWVGNIELLIHFTNNFVIVNSFIPISLKQMLPNKYHSRTAAYPWANRSVWLLNYSSFLNKANQSMIQLHINKDLYLVDESAKWKSGCVVCINFWMYALSFWLFSAVPFLKCVLRHL